MLPLSEKVFEFWRWTCAPLRVKSLQFSRKMTEAPNNTPDSELLTPEAQIRHIEPACPARPKRPAHPPRKTASWGAKTLQEAWAGETTVSMDASLRRCAAASAFEPVTPSPPEGKPKHLIPRVTPEEAVRKSLLDEDLAWATA